ncbi:MAG TPA: hypothetical protein PK890_00215 [Terrimesophilobacter sp.]|nr:hypothetical protein [Terrimesophilobacter sp.]
MSALWRTPDNSRTPERVVVQGPGWMGSKDARLYLQYHEALTQEGLGVLSVDYREIRRDDHSAALVLERQIRDLENAVTYVQALDFVDPNSIGAFGNGATGASNAIMLASRDVRVSAVVAQFPISDGPEWLRGMRNAEEWAVFLHDLEVDREQRIAGRGRLVDPVREITLPFKEREATGAKSDVANRVPKEVSLAVADAVMSYRPLRAMPFVTAPTLFITVEGDLVTPEKHAMDLYESARCERKLMVHRDTTHYRSYETHGAETCSAIAEWFDQHLGAKSRVTRRTG